MTISFPRDMPAVGANAVRFELQRSDYLSPEKSGRLGAVAGGWPLWSMSLALANMDEATGDIWRAWADAQRGPQKVFYGYKLGREVPRAHRDGRPYAHDAAAWSQSVDVSGTALLTLTGLLAGQVVSTGDFIGFIWNTDRRALVRAIETGAASASGDVTVAIEPAVPVLVVPGSAVATVHYPTCRMRLTPDTSLGEEVPGLITTAGGRIVALQDLVA